ncbi:MAG: 6-pyruvoyl-tetrahydropterin synthase-related protein [Candidatus Aquicultor sp.]
MRLSRLAVVLGFIAIYGTLFSFFKPDLIFSATTTAGGDTGAHHYVADFLIHHLLPKGRIAGWSPGWYMGFPMLHYYFPLGFLAIAAMSTVIKYQIAFKIGTLLGVFLLPATTYAAFKVLDFKFPFPLIAAGFTLPFLFMESYSIYGGNILSTLAGEFGYSLSFSLLILFLALLYRDIKEQRFRVSTGVLLAMVVLSHVVTTIMALAFSTYFLLNRFNIKRFAILAGVFVLGFFLTAFWSLPFAAKIGYTAHMQWDQLQGINEILPAPLRPFVAISAVGILGAIIRRDSRMYLFLWTFVMSLALFFLVPSGRLWNGRVVPFFYYFSFIWAAYGIWFLRRVLAGLFYDYVLLPKRYADYVVAAIAIAVVVVTVFGTSQTAPAWINWNYSGFEGKAHWKDFNAINTYIKSLPPGRVMVEHSSKIDTFGTPRAFELLPYFAGHPTIEGTLMEASLSAPFHFVNQAELSKEPSCAILGIQYPQLNVADGVRHLQLYNIDYFLTISNEVKLQANKNPDLALLKKFKVSGTDMEFALYKVDTDGYVVIPKYMPLMVDTKDWRTTALAWYSKPRLFDVPLVDATQARALKDTFRTVSADLEGPIRREPARKGRITNVIITDDGLDFTTSAIGVPHLIRISYFPNWKVEGADGPYLASPTIMMVVPRQRHVHLYFGETWSDTTGRILSDIAWLFVAAYALMFAVRKISSLRSPSQPEDAEQGDSTGFAKERSA